MKFNQTHFVVNVTLFVKKDSRFRVIPDSMLSLYSSVSLNFMELQHVFFWVIRMFIAKMLHAENIKMCFTKTLHAENIKICFTKMLHAENTKMCFTKMLHAENIKMCFIGVLSLIIAVMKIFPAYLTLFWLEFSL